MVANLSLFCEISLLEPTFFRMFACCLLSAYCLLTADAVVYHPLLHNDMVIFLVVTYSLCFLDII